MVIENDYMSIEEIQESGRVGLLYENLSDKLIDSLQVCAIQTTCTYVHQHSHNFAFHRDII